MFEKELEDKFRAIFKVKDVSYDAPGDSREHDKLWIEVENPKFTYGDKIVKAVITGKGSIFGDNNDIKFGFLSNAIATASAELTKDLFFSDFETNRNRFRGIVERSFSFTYFFNSQFDPDIGTITSVTTSVEET